MGHLNELQEKYASKGFTVISVTNEGREAVDPWVEKHGAQFPIIIEKGNSADEYGISGFPSSFLIAPDGTIAWAGHPAGVEDSKIEELLKDARLFPDLPAKLSSVRKAVEKSKYGDAYRAVAKVLEAGDLTGSEEEAATQVKSWLEWNLSTSLERAAKATEGNDPYAAWKAYTDVAKSWKGKEEADRAAALAKELMADKANKLEITAGKKLDKLRKRLGDMSPKKAIKPTSERSSARRDRLARRAPGAHLSMDRIQRAMRSSAFVSGVLWARFGMPLSSVRCMRR